MCGIVGQVKRPGETPDRDQLVRMCVALEHRGPDSRGLFVDENVGLGIQRLRVVDLLTGDQPIGNEDESVMVVLNGEIYNFAELRTELLGRGHTFRTQADTEVIVHLYEEIGVHCVERLHGMFAFALWDRRQRQLLLARDRIGKKPLFYSVRDGALSFASELGALMQDREIPREIDPAAIDCYLAYGYVPTPRSVFTSVSKLPPAHTLVLRDGRTTLERYWRLDYARKLDVKDPRELHEPIRGAIRDATRRRLVADVPVGAFLSGGIDSSAVVAAMSEVGGGPVKTFSIGFEQSGFDELPYARRVAELFGTEHHEFVVRPDAISMAPKIARHYGEPFADSSAIPSFYLAEVTRRHVTVALNGDGGDESFGGYTRYVSNRLAARLDRLPGPLRRAAAVVANRPQRGEITSLVNRARRLGQSLALDPPNRYARYMSFFDETQRAALYSPEFRASVGESSALSVIADPWRSSSGGDVLDVMLDVDSSTYLPDDLIAKIDIATMAHGLEARSPLLDHELMQFAASIPADLKVRHTHKKWILRQALRDWLPSEILNRPKQGFQVPIDHWFRNELHDHVHEVLLDPGSLARGYFRAEAVESALDRISVGTYADASRLWALFMLELWQRELVDTGGRPASADTVDTYAGAA
jgi:asparagine synthase (glutamine-hydrolysing)